MTNFEGIKIVGNYSSQQEHSRKCNTQNAELKVFGSVKSLRCHHHKGPSSDSGHWLSLSLSLTLFLSLPLSLSLVLFLHAHKDRHTWKYSDAQHRRNSSVSIWLAFILPVSLNPYSLVLVIWIKDGWDRWDDWAKIPARNRDLTLRFVHSFNRQCRALHWLLISWTSNRTYKFEIRDY